MSPLTARILQELLRLIPVNVGRNLVAQRYLRAHVDSLPTITCVRTQRGRALIVPGDHVSRTVYWWGDYDPRITKICRLVLRPGDTFADIGANIGIVGLNAAPIVGPTGQVHCFEPQPRLAHLIREAASLSKTPWLVVHDLALSDKDGFQDLVVPIGNSGAASFSRNALARHCEIVTVEVRQAGKLMAALCKTRPKLFKIDVEGHEVTLLRALRPFMDKQAPSYLVVETNDVNPNNRYEIVDLLLECQYELFGIQRTVFGLRLSRLQTRWDCKYHDIVGRHRSVAESQLACPLGRFVV